MTDDYSYLFDYKMRMTDLQDLAAIDRMAAELRPQSALSRWAEQRASQRRSRRGLGRGRYLPRTGSPKRGATTVS